MIRCTNVSSISQTGGITVESGANGIDASYPYLSVGSMVLVGDNGGVVSDYSNAVTTFRFYSGNTEVDLTGKEVSIAFSASGITYVLADEVGGKGKVLTITYMPAAMSAESVDLIYFYAGELYTKRLYLSKVNKGATGNQLIWCANPSIFVVSPANPSYTKGIANLPLNYGDVLSWRIDLETAGNSAISAYIKYPSFVTPVNLTSLNVNELVGITIESNLHVVSYNAGTGNLSYTVDARAYVYKTGTAGICNSAYRVINLENSSFVQPLVSKTIDLGVYVYDTYGVTVRQMKVEYKKNYNNTLNIW